MGKTFIIADEHTRTSSFHFYKKIIMTADIQHYYRVVSLIDFMQVIVVCV